MHDRAQRGFTLVELVIVMVILGILIAVAVPGYAGMRTRSSDSTAQANLRSVAQPIAAYYNDNGTYVGMTIGRLRRNYDRAIGRGIYRLRGLTATSYCVQTTVGGRTWNRQGPAGVIASGACP